MAINIKNWIDVSTTTLPASTPDRDLGLRIITKNSLINANTVYEMTSAEDVATTFSTASDEYKIAVKYFSYVSNSATKPQQISFWRPGTHTNPGESGTTIEVEDDIPTTLGKMEQVSDNFGTFFFVNRSDYNYNSVDTSLNNVFAAAATWAASKNYKFRYVVPVFMENIAENTGFLTWTKKDYAEARLANYKKACVTAVLDDAFVNNQVSTYPEWFTCALLASTRYSRTNSTIIQEFKGLNSTDMTVTCDSDSLYNILTGLNINFFGRTMKAGKTLDFYMEGYNLDGVDTAVCDNEMWLKDRVVSEVFNRFTQTGKVPAGAIGRAMIRSAIVEVLTEGLNNLSIVPEKEISDSEKAAIIQATGATDAPAHLFTMGWYLDVKEGTQTVGSATRRTVDYVLYYSTGEGVRKVTGSHVLV